MTDGTTERSHNLRLVGGGNNNNSVYLTVGITIAQWNLFCYNAIRNI